MAPELGKRRRVNEVEEALPCENKRAKKKKKKKQQQQQQQRRESAVPSPSRRLSAIPAAAARGSSGAQLKTDARPSSMQLGEVNKNWMRLQAKLNKTRLNSPMRSSELRNNRLAQSTNTSASTSTTDLCPVNDDCSLTHELAIDCEMVGVGHEGRRSALARVSVVNSWGNVVFDKHVRPLEPVTNLRTEISGVRARDLKKAENLWVVQKEIAQLISGRILVGHAIHYDLKVMYLSHPRRFIRDTSCYRPLRSKTGGSRSLRDLSAEFLGAKIQDGEHNSTEDARAVMFIYQRFKKEWEQSLCRRPRSQCIASIATRDHCSQLNT